MESNHKEVVKELIQYEMNEANIRRELELLLHDPNKKNSLKQDCELHYETLKAGISGNSMTTIRTDRKLLTL